jgi:hypothetical protein
MSPGEFVLALRKRGVAVTASKGALKVCPMSKLTPVERTYVREHGCLMANALLAIDEAARIDAAELAAMDAAVADEMDYARSRHDKRRDRIAHLATLDRAEMRRLIDRGTVSAEEVRAAREMRRERG